jgi:hypothetical protein
MSSNAKKHKDEREREKKKGKMSVRETQVTAKTMSTGTTKAMQKKILPKFV